MAGRITLIAAALAALTTVSTPAFAQDSGAYLAARQAIMTNDFATASRFLTIALARDPSNPELLESAVAANLALGQVRRAVPMATKLEEDGLPSQIGYMVTLADMGAEERYSDILSRLEANKGASPLVDGLLQAWANIGAGDMSAALAAFDDVANERGLAGFANYHRALALASVGDFESAENLLADPSSGAAQMTRRGVMARVEILSQLDRNQDALDLIAELFGSRLDSGLEDMKARLEAGEPLPFTHVTNAREGMAEVFFSFANALASEAGEDTALLFARVAEHLRPDHTDALLLSADLLETLGRFELAVEAYRRVPAGDPSFHAAELGRAEALRRSGNVSAAIEALTQLTRTHNTLPLVHATLGDVLRGEKRYGDAVEAYNSALDRYEADDEARWFVLYTRGISLERQGDWENAEKDFRAALDLRPDQPQILNYLGYTLVEKQIKLDEALGMIERAVEARPDSGYIIDSLGWVLYRLGRYDEAVGHMERAVELEAVDPIVNDHLGDVYWAVGRFTEAQFQWRRALSFITEDTPSQDVDAARIRRKIDVGLDVVLEEEGAPPLRVANEN